MRVAVLLLLVTLAPLTATGQPLEPLFVHRGAAAAVDAGRGDDAILSRAYVGVRLDLLFDVDGAAAQVLVNTGTQSYVARLERLDRDASGFRSWVGRLDGIADSHIVITERAGVVSGLVTAGDLSFQIQTLAPGAYVLERVDVSRLREDRDPIETAVSAHPADVVTGQGYDGSVIDVLMLYSPAARAQRGGTAQIQALAAQVISDTNTAFSRSGIAVRARLAGAHELPIVESAQMAQDLATVRDSAVARNLRDALRADIVQLLVSSPDPFSCGVGYLLTSLSATAFNPYSVADVACTAQYTPTHEIGHNLGAHHAPEDGASFALFPYSYGYKDPARGFRTVMAYNCGPIPCPRILSFSNPGLAHNGGATGTVTQNNARTIAEAAFTVANFRQATPASSPVVSVTPPTGLQSSVGGNTVTLAWSASTNANFYALHVGTAPGASNVFNASVGAATSATGTLPAGQYFWRVTAVGSGGSTAASGERLFTVAGCAVPPAPLSLTGSVAAGVVTLRWSPPAGAAGLTYLLEAGSAAGQANLLIASVGPVTEIVTPAPPGTYYVRVRAHSACGAGAPSNELAITVVP